MVEALCGTFVAVAIFVAVASFARGVYAMFKAAANRKTGIGYLAALRGVNRRLRPGLYTDDGLKWRTVYNRCVLGYLLGIIAAFVVETIRGGLR
jgi:hypothetical protein